MAAERWGGGRPDGGAVFKIGTNKRDIEPDNSRGGGMGRDPRCGGIYNKLKICEGAQER